MIVGAVAASLSVMLAIVASRAASTIEVRLARMSRSGRTPIRHFDQAVVARASGALAGALAGCVVGVFVGVGLLAVPVSAFAGWSAGSTWHERRESERAREAERALVTLVEWLHALVLSGRPLESAVARCVTIATGADRLDDALRQAHSDYALGVPLHHALATAGARRGVRGLASLAERVARARDMGRAALPMLEDVRDELRAAERARMLERASQVDGKLTLILTLCYLPALALLVMIPLFLTLLAGLFG